MSFFRTWFRTPRIRRSLAAGAVVLAAGGLVLSRTPAGAHAALLTTATTTASGANSTNFRGPGAIGTFALSHGQLLAGAAEQPLYAELDLRAEVTAAARERAPLAIAVVLDTSGSMTGEKIEQAKQAVIQLIGDLRDDDQVAFVRYSDSAQLLQPLASAGAVRGLLTSRVAGIQAGGGTSIAPALSMGIHALDDAASGRVKRVVLASDGLDATRLQSEAFARESAARGVTVSSMGIGLDFDESYMGSIAQVGHGNFAFVKDGAALAGFLQRELRETATTVVESAHARLDLPDGVRFVRAIGADARALDGGRAIELSMGSLFAGDERRVIVELAARLGDGERRALDGEVRWTNVSGESALARIAGLGIQGTLDATAVAASRDGAVLAHATSALASIRQVEAAAAYAQGDTGRAQALIDRNVADLNAVAAAAPPAAAPALARQAEEFEHTKQIFAAAPPKSAAGNAAAKRAVERNLDNQQRSAF